MITIRPAKVKEARKLGEQFLTLAQRNASESHPEFQYNFVSPKWDMFAELEMQGKLLCLGAYNDSELIGYSVNIVTEHLHYSTVTFCMNDAVFVLPEFRSGHTVGLDLIKETEHHAKLLGCELMDWHAPKDSILHKLLLSKKYQEREVILERGL